MAESRSAKRRSTGIKNRWNAIFKPHSRQTAISNDDSHQTDKEALIHAGATKVWDAKERPCYARSAHHAESSRGLHAKFQINDGPSVEFTGSSDTVSRYSHNGRNYACNKTSETTYEVTAFPLCARSTSHVPNYKSSPSSTRTVRANAIGGELRDPTSDVDAEETAMVSCHTKKKQYTQASACTGTIGAHDPLSTQLQQTVLPPIPPKFLGHTALADNTPVVPHGHSYQYVRVKDHAHVHMGDQYIINYNCPDILAAMQQFEDAEPDERAVILQLAASVIAVTILHAITRYIFLFVGAIHPAGPNAIQQRVPSLLSKIGYRLAFFEDAFGQVVSIDIDVITNWSAFQDDLTRAFRHKPGHRRVVKAGYRLFDRAHSDQVINPKNPPPFAKVFRAKAHVQMSIHFGWDEVSVDYCPKCGLEQACEPGVETTCKNRDCGFHYRGQVEEVGEVEENREYWERHQNISDKTLRDEEEELALFSRISVSKKTPGSSSAQQYRQWWNFSTQEVRSLPYLEKMKVGEGHSAKVYKVKIHKESRRPESEDVLQRELAYTPCSIP